MSHTLHEIQRFLAFQARSQPARPFDRLLRYVSDWTVLDAAWRQVRRSRGADTPGADRLTAGDLAADPASARAFLQELADALQAGAYRPGAVRRFELAKPGRPGETRPLAILGLADRVVHMALKLVLEPIVEARLGERSFGFRHGRGRYDQLLSVRRLVQANPARYAAALSADIAACFDQLDHALLLSDLRALVTDPAVVGLFRLVLEQVGGGRKGWLRRRGIGVLQGSPLSPLLANWNLVRFDRAWRQRHGEDAPAFRYADDLVILARDEAEAARLRRPLDDCLKRSNRLALAAAKTRVSSFEEGISLLGLTVRRHRDPFDEREHTRIFLDAEKFRLLLGEIDAWVERLAAGRSLGRQFAQFNRRLRGWFETYQYAHDAAQAFETLDQHLFRSVRRKLKELLGCSAAALQQQHLRLASGHDTWQVEGEALLVLSALPRRCYRPKRVRPPWELSAARSKPATALLAPPSLLALPNLPSDLLPAAFSAGSAGIPPASSAESAGVSPASSAGSAGVPPALRSLSSALPGSAGVPPASSKKATGGTPVLPGGAGVPPASSKKATGGTPVLPGAAGVPPASSKKATGGTPVLPGAAGVPPALASHQPLPPRTPSNQGTSLNPSVPSSNGTPKHPDLKKGPTQ